jgi:hypothetical protein
MFGHTDLPPLQPMAGFTQVREVGRATLTFLRDGSFVLGCPDGAFDMAKREAIDNIKRYLTGENDVIVLPWPTDVIVLPWPTDVYDERSHD